ncbi:hypothetical protein SAMN05443999_11540 [Roseovarius azorensis]|uniref:DUF5681 domain-containing protein n=1 Tax=Roseovarius azorensis TaxID=1287727 RepID=A0A1H7WG00_9RHOB|nr:DUF5681 domain-containing protein [Roseovarius azorensis]SEM20015.1 hypothetical protein SAMN05443999_11540 [Roseovarius azorensis]
MSGEKTRLLVHKPDADYEVGYAKPPKDTRFKPGQSGNPMGRPRGAKNKRPALNEERLKDIILDEAYRDITVRDGDRNVTVPMAQAVMRALAVNAAKGQHRAQRLFAEMLATTERQNKQLSDEWLQTAIAYKVDWERELQRRAQMGITHLPAPLPHPDQVRIDMNKGTAWIQGPMTKDDLKELEVWRERRKNFEDERDYLLEHLDTEKNRKTRKFMEDDLAQTQKILGLIDQVLDRIGY